MAVDEPNDIKNLFAEIGVNGGAYRDITREEARRDSLARWPLLSSVQRARVEDPGQGPAEQPAPPPDGPAQRTRAGQQRIEPLLAASASPLPREAAAPAPKSPPVAQFVPPRPRSETVARVHGRLPIEDAPGPAPSMPPAARPAPAGPELREVFARLAQPQPSAPAGSSAPSPRSSLLQRLNRL